MRAEVGWGLNPRVEFAKPVNDGGLDPPTRGGGWGAGYPSEPATGIPSRGEGPRPLPPAVGPSVVNKIAPKASKGYVGSEALCARLLRPGVHGWHHRLTRDRAIP